MQLKKGDKLLIEAESESNNQDLTKKESRINQQPESIPILSFFTGAGFLDIGFMQAGFTNIIWRNEVNPYFIKGFEYGISTLLKDQKTHHRINNKQSIENITSQIIETEAFSECKPKYFGIIGGPPCPDFSIGGKNKGREGNHGKLSQAYVNRIIELQPTFFLLENVAGLWQTQKHRLYLNELKKQLKDSGYLLSNKILNALDFGVPQDRKRFFLVGFHKSWFGQNDIELDNEEWFPWPAQPYESAKTRYNWPRTTSPFKGTPEKPADIPEELTVGYHLDNLENSDLDNTKEWFKPHSKKFEMIEEGDVSRKSFKRLHRWRYSPAAAYGNNEVHLHPTEARRLSVREAMRIQSVPDEYAFPSSIPLSYKFKMIGNGVPVKLAQAVASSFVEVLSSEWNPSTKLSGTQEMIEDCQQLSIANL